MEYVKYQIYFPLLAPASITSPPESANVKPGSTVTFQCKYDGNPRPDVKWFKGSKQIKDADRYVLSNKSQVAKLEIDDVNDSDAGDYRVVVSNEYGDKEKSFSLTTQSAKKDDANGPATSAKSKSRCYCSVASMLYIRGRGVQ